MREDRHPHDGSRAIISARWFPVYLEPIRHSGERITIGVAVITDNPAENRLVSTLPIDVTKCLYRNRFEQLKDIADIGMDELRAFLSTSSDIEEFQFTLAGTEIGPVRAIREFSIEAMLRIAASSTSSLNALEPDVIAAEPRHLKWQESIQDIILSKRPSLTQRFNQPLKLKNRVIANIGYVGNRFAANFHDFSSITNISYHVTRCSRALMDMQAFLNIGGLQFENNDWTGLIIHQPDLTVRELKRFNTHMETLDTYAESLKMEVKRVKNSEEAAELILSDAG
jgi:hypothetical protein